MTTSIQASFAERLQISECEWTLVANILAEHTSTRSVWAFGSRATGLRVKRFSDLDLAISGRLDLAERSALTEAFDNALINFKVDVVEVDQLDPDFRQRIERDFLLLKPAASMANGTA